MKIINKVVVMIFLVYTCVMVAGVMQDYKLFNLNKNDVVIVNRVKDESDETPVEIMGKVEKLSENEGLCLYNFEIENNVKTYYFVNQSSCNTFIEIITKHKEHDYDGMNIIDVSTSPFKMNLLSNIYIIDNSSNFNLELLNTYELNNYGIATLENESNLMLFLKKYIILLLILLMISVVIIIFDVHESKKRLYYSKVYGISFNKAILNSSIMKSIYQYLSISIIVTALLTYLLKSNLTFFTICIVFIFIFLLICYSISIIILYFEYKKIEYKNSFLISKKNIFFLGGLYTIILVVFLTSLSEIGQLWYEQKMFISEIEKNSNVYTIPNIPTISFTLREKNLRDIQDNSDALSILQGPEINENTYNINLNYLSHLNIDTLKLDKEVREGLAYVIYPKARDDVKRQIEGDYNRRDVEVPEFIPYDGNIEIDTFDPLNPKVKNPTLIVEKYVYSSENSYYFITDSPDILETTLNEIYTDNNIDAVTKPEPYSKRFENYLLNIKQSITNILILLSFYILSSIYFLFIIIIELFQIQRKTIILQIFYGMPFYRIAKNIIYTVVTAHIIATIIAILCDIPSAILILKVSLILGGVDLIFIVGCIYYLTKKNIPLFLKGDL